MLCSIPAKRIQSRLLPLPHRPQKPEPIEPAPAGDDHASNLCAAFLSTGSAVLYEAAIL